METTDYEDFLMRLIRRLVVRASDDPVVLGVFLRIGRALSEGLRVAVKAQHAAGYSCTEIGRELGVTRQAVHERFFKDQPHSDRDGDPITEPLFQLIEESA